MIKAIKWVIVNSGFLALLYFAVIEQVTGARNLVIFMTWLMALVSIVALYSDEVQEKIKQVGRSVPKSVDITFDLFVLAVLVWHSFWVTSVVYLIHFVYLNAAYETALEGKEKS